MNRALLSLLLLAFACTGDSPPVPPSPPGTTSKDAAEQKALEALAKRAEGGETAAIIELADLRLAGSRVPKDEAAALRGYERGAEAGSGYAMLKAAQLHERGIGTPASQERACAWYLRAAGAGVKNARDWVEAHAATDGACAYALAKLLVAEHPQDPAERQRAIKLLEQAHAAKHPQAAGELALLLLDTEPVAYPRVRTVLLDGVQAGDPVAMDLLATMHDEGWGVEAPRGDQAVALWTRAAKLGSAAAMAKVGRAHARGRGATRDAGRALDWLRKAELAGSTLAKVELARLHLAGAGGAEKSAARANELLDEAARLGDLEAMEALGDLALAEEIFPDLVRRYAEAPDTLGPRINAHRGAAERWYVQASEGRRLTAMKKAGDLYSLALDGHEPNLTLARMHYEPALAELGRLRRLGRYTDVHRELEGDIKAGYGVALFNRRSFGEGADRTTALTWIDEAIALGSARAMGLRGELCLFAVGNPLDLDTGLEWYTKAAKAGDPTAKAVIAATTTGGKLDPAKTLKFYEAAARNGDARAAKLLDTVKAELARRQAGKK